MISMKIEDIMTTNIVSASPEETVSSALAKMKKKRVHQLPVIGKKLEGMLLLKRIVTRDLDASNTKVSSVMSEATTVGKEDDTHRAAELIILSGQRALPVVERGIVIGILSETDMMKAVPQMNYRVSDIMSQCEYVEKDDDIGKVKKIMAYSNISRVPVVENGKIVGIIGTLDMIDIMLRRDQMQAGGLLKSAKEAVSVDKTLVENVMKEPVIVDNGEAIQNAAKLLLQNDGIFVEDKGKFFIVTPKDVVELIAKEKKEGIYVQISNLGDVDAFTNAKIEKKVTEFVQKMGRMMDNLHIFAIHVERHEKQGKNIKYSVRTRFLTPLGLFVSRSWGWSLATAFQDAIDNLEKEIMKKHDRVAHHERAKKSKEFFR